MAYGIMESVLDERLPIFDETQRLDQESVSGKRTKRSATLHSDQRIKNGLYKSNTAGLQGVLKVMERMNDLPLLNQSLTEDQVRETLEKTTMLTSALHPKRMFKEGWENMKDDHNEGGAMPMIEATMRTLTNVTANFNRKIGMAAPDISGFFNPNNFLVVAMRRSNEEFKKLGGYKTYLTFFDWGHHMVKEVTHKVWGLTHSPTDEIDIPCEVFVGDCYNSSVTLVVGATNQIADSGRRNQVRGMNFGRCISC